MRNDSCMTAQARHQDLNCMKRTLTWTTFFSVLLRSSCGRPSFQSGFSVLWPVLTIVPFCHCWVRCLRAETRPTDLPPLQSSLSIEPHFSSPRTLRKSGRNHDAACTPNRLSCTLLHQAWNFFHDLGLSNCHQAETCRLTCCCCRLTCCCCRLTCHYCSSYYYHLGLQVVVHRLSAPLFSQIGKNLQDRSRIWHSKGCPLVTHHCLYIHILASLSFRSNHSHAPNRSFWLNQWLIFYYKQILTQPIHGPRGFGVLGFWRFDWNEMKSYVKILRA